MQPYKTHKEVAPAGMTCAALYGWDTRVGSPSGYLSNQLLLLRYNLPVYCQGKTRAHTPTLDIEESDDVEPEVQILKHVSHNKDFYKPGTSKKAKL